MDTCLVLHLDVDPRIGEQYLRTPTNRVFGARPRTVRPHAMGTPSTKKAPRSPTASAASRAVPTQSGRLTEKLYEGVRGNHRSEEVVDTLQRWCELLGLLRASGVADHDWQITVVARGARITLDAPVSVNAGQHDDLDPLARELQGKLHTDKRGQAPGQCRTRLDCRR